MNQVQVQNTGSLSQTEKLKKRKGLKMIPHSAANPVSAKNKQTNPTLKLNSNGVYVSQFPLCYKPRATDPLVFTTVL